MVGTQYTALVILGESWNILDMLTHVATCSHMFLGSWPDDALIPKTYHGHVLKISVLHFLFDLAALWARWGSFAPGTSCDFYSTLCRSSDLGTLLNSESATGGLTLRFPMQRLLVQARSNDCRTTSRLFTECSSFSQRVSRSPQSTSINTLLLNPNSKKAVDKLCW